MGKIFRCEILKAESSLRFKDIEDKLDLKGFFWRKATATLKRTLNIARGILKIRNT